MGIMMMNPVTKHASNVAIKNQSIWVKSSLLSMVTVMKIKSGPQAHHSAQIAAGDATFSTSIHEPPQLKTNAKNVAIVPYDFNLETKIVRIV